MASKSAEPTSSYKYFEGNSFCPALVRPARTSVPISDAEYCAMVCVSMGSPRAGWLFLNAAKSGVCVPVMRLEPVAKRPTQHARGGARRAAFHHKMLAVKKVCGVAGIKRQRAKSLEGLKHRARPFPPVAKEGFDAKRPGAGRVRGHRAGTPA